MASEGALAKRSTLAASRVHWSNMDLPEFTPDQDQDHHGNSSQDSVRKWLTTTEEDAKHEPLQEAAEPLKRSPSSDDDLALGLEGKQPPALDFQSSFLTDDVCIKTKGTELQKETDYLVLDTMPVSNGVWDREAEATAKTKTPSGGKEQRGGGGEEREKREKHFPNIAQGALTPDLDRMC
ncbi:hypothetical protein NQZ68_027682 [Dissostichus eleginoides]|nr:hypothetical protein NQZ68_027682 [Dissostichus eleginoides]